MAQKKRRVSEITDEDRARGKRIHDARLQKRWSQIVLAKKLGISQASVSNMETGMTKEPKHFPMAEAALGLTPIPEFVAPPPSATASFVPVFEIIVSERGSGKLSKVAISSTPSPADLAHIQDRYAFYVFFEDMRPRYRPGELLVIHPRTPPRLEDGVALRGKNDELVVREFIRSTPTEWIVKHYGDSPGEDRLSRSEWPVCHVVWEVLRR